MIHDVAEEKSETESSLSPPREHDPATTYTSPSPDGAESAAPELDLSGIVEAVPFVDPQVN